MVSRETLLARFTSLLLEANQRTNLVSRRLGEDEVRDLVRAFSQTLVAVRLPAPARLVDVGTGGGLPGIPLAITYPDTHVVLIESRRRRVECLTGFVEELDLDNVTLYPGRAQSAFSAVGRSPVVTAFGVGKPLATMDLIEPLLDDTGVAILSCPSHPSREELASWLLHAAMANMSAQLFSEVLPGPRSVLQVSRYPQ